MKQTCLLFEDLRELVSFFHGFPGSTGQADFSGQGRPAIESYIVLRMGEEELVEVSVILEDLTVVKVRLVDLSFSPFTDICWNRLFHFLKLELLSAQMQHQLFPRPSSLSQIPQGPYSLFTLMRGVGVGLATLPSDFFCQWSTPFPLINSMKNLFMQCLGFPEARCHSDRRRPSLLEQNKQDELMPCHNLWPIIRKLCNFNYIKLRFLNQPQFAELSLSENYLYLIFSLSLHT